MLVRVDAADDRPIYQQIVTQITYGIAAGVLRAGEAIPSVRDMAAQALVNPNTVARAYRELRTAGVIEQRRGLGLFVTQTAPGACRRTRADEVRARLRDVLREAAASDLPTADIERIVAQELKALKQENPPT